ncbi:hypothetical protein ACFFMP_15045 [Pseudoroseomonas cervicalis]|uniref:Phosphate-selective porin O and P n=1 Tax=Pseudoroseomonas cervicalis ATCC 49957 TaxID=525371 RepID=D5RJT3_9PROT|nr:hypothetical protein [Pseudoroseomonas cervicalis]EFH12437.1 hypothetical protein HMPREF0731_1343 [Pseudoroseomonas cervicalis ATCC 49957]
MCPIPPCPASSPRRPRGTALLLAAPLLLGAGLARAEEAPVRLAAGDFAIEGSLDTELDVDRNGRRGGRRAYTDLYNKTELEVTLTLPRGFAIEGSVKSEPAPREADGSDRAFRGQAAWVETLLLSWTEGPLRLFAGKLHPRFGFAWDRAPGLYGTDFAEGYELSEKIGFGASLSLSDLAGLDEDWGRHSLQLEMFQADRTALSSSLFSYRHAVLDASGRTRYSARNRRAYGGADNTRGYQNAVLSLEGSGIALPLGSLDYTLGLSSRRAGLDSAAAGTAATERGSVAGLAWTIPLPLEMSATPLVEWLRQRDADGIGGLRRDVLTAGLSLQRGPVTLAYAYEWLKERGPAPQQAAQNTASVTYDLGELAAWLKGFDATLGWRRLREEGQSANDYGAQLHYSVTF